MISPIPFTVILLGDSPEEKVKKKPKILLASKAEIRKSSLSAVESLREDNSNLKKSLPCVKEDKTLPLFPVISHVTQHPTEEVSIGLNLVFVYLTKSWPLYANLLCMQLAQFMLRCNRTEPMGR